MDDLAHADLGSVRARLADTLKRAPDDQGARMYLWQVMAVQGDWDKAANQLRSLASLSGEAQMLATVYGQALAAEKQRALAYAGSAPAPVLVSTSPWIEQLAASFAAAPDEAVRLREEAFDAAGDTPGEADGRRFAWLADIDPRLGPSFEAIVAGRWGLVPFEAVSSLKTEGPRDLRDVVWLPVQMALRSGQSAAALLPARYPGTERASDAARLGRATEWDGDHPVGQRVWSLDDGSELGLLDVQSIVMT